MLKFRTILHPTDFSPAADYAFQFAASLAHDHGARLVVLHVAPPETEDYGVVDLFEKNRAYNEKLWDVFHRTEAVDPRVREIHMDTDWVDGDPACEILRAAREVGCDLIVMGTHGRTGLARLLMGSVAEGVLRKAPCPVLTVKPPEPNKEPQVQEVEEATEAVGA